MKTLDTDAPDPADRVLALARSGAAHDVNNLLTVLRGNLHLLQLVGADQAPVLLAEIELACTRLGLLSDEWSLAGAPPAGGIDGDGDAPSCNVVAGLHAIVDLLGRALQTEFRCRIDAAAERLICGLSDRAWRAMLHGAVRALVRAAGATPVRLRLLARAGTGGVLLLRASCPGASRLGLDAPSVLAGHPGVYRIDSGLWDAARALQQRGGSLALGRGARHAWLRLVLPAAGAAHG